MTDPRLIAALDQEYAKACNGYAYLEKAYRTCLEVCGLGPERTAVHFVAGLMEADPELDVASMAGFLAVAFARMVEKEKHESP